MEIGELVRCVKKMRYGAGKTGQMSMVSWLGKLKTRRHHQHAYTYQKYGLAPLDDLGGEKK